MGLKIPHQPNPLDEELVALLRLCGLKGIGSRTVCDLVESYGTAAAAIRALVRGHRNAEHSRPGAARLLRILRAGIPLPDAESVGAELGSWKRRGMQVRGLHHASYPDLFRALHDPPPVLFLEGDRDLLARSGIAIVGARNASPYGRRVARELGRAVAERGGVVISGLATGIDAEAHQGALDVGGDTVAVLGAGLSRPYPRSNVRLHRTIGKHGLLVSEFLPDAPPERHNFPRRNRLIAALAHTVVLVEADVRSGSLITADHALDLGKDVFAVPGPIDSPTSAGTNNLVREGAQPLVDIGKWLSDLSAAGVFDSTGEPPLPLTPDATGTLASPSTGPPPVLGRGLGSRSLDTPIPEEQLATLSDEEKQIWKVLADGALSVEELSIAAGIPANRLLATLTRLEIRGVLQREAGMRFSRGAGCADETPAQKHRPAV